MSVLSILMFMVVLALGGYFLWKSKTEDGWDFTMGTAALAALGTAVYGWFAGFFS